MPEKYKPEKQGFIYREAAHGPLVMFAHPNKRSGATCSPFSRQHCRHCSAPFHHHHSVNAHHYAHTPHIG